MRGERWWADLLLLVLVHVIAVEVLLAHEARVQQLPHTANIPHTNR
jgi:hypothetical protein